MARVRILLDSIHITHQHASVGLTRESFLTLLQMWCEKEKINYYDTMWTEQAWLDGWYIHIWLWVDEKEQERVYARPLLSAESGGN